MSFLTNLSYSDEVTQDKDTVGGNFSLFESGVYPATIKYAYLSQAKSGAGAVNFEFDVEGKTLKETMYVTNKEGKNYYERNGQRNYLPSFVNADAISLFASGKPLFEQKDETKIINLYNFETKSEVPTEVPMLTALIGKQVKLGILKEKVFKQEKTDNGYQDTEETREQNSINKVFSAKDNRTVNEVRAEQSDAVFINTWLDKWEGQTNDKTLGKKPTQSSPAKKTSSLFA
ncbi:hypothetical protein ACFBZI_10535 [Moraxella sp. ZJ142]|uniref:hypothetical protein n=1 Tax=Moraxella marmotae TaxID=3344520 RepID=UPI0035D4876B